MSRVDYSDEEDFPGQWALWDQNLKRSLAGAKGQAALRDLATALESMPEKQLIHGHLSKGGNVCAVGAVIVQRQTSLGKARDEALCDLEAAYSMCDNSSCWHAKQDHGPEGCAKCAKYPTQRQCLTFAPSEDVDEYDDEEFSTQTAGVAAGIPKLVAWRLVALNDLDLEDATPEERYRRVLAWTNAHLIPPAPSLKNSVPDVGSPEA